jgi:hypothetical protein
LRHFGHGIVTDIQCPDTSPQGPSRPQ